MTEVGEKIPSYFLELKLLDNKLDMLFTEVKNLQTSREQDEGREYEKDGMGMIEGLEDENEHE
ncbi:unnamed protein product, partial [Citrullus colocynthis]